MSFILPALPQAQTISEGEMPDTVTIHHPGVPTQNEYGAMVDGASADTVTKGRISAATERDLEHLEGGELRQTGLEVLKIPKAVAVVGRDTVAVTSARNGTVVNYSVEGIVPMSSFAVHRKLLVRRL